MLVVLDYFSRYHEIAIVFSTTSEKIIESLERIFVIHGLSLSVTSDNGLQFIQVSSKDIWNDVVMSTGKPHLYGPKLT